MPWVSSCLFRVLPIYEYQSWTLIPRHWSRLLENFLYWNGRACRAHHARPLRHWFIMSPFLTFNVSIGIPPRNLYRSTWYWIAWWKDVKEMQRYRWFAWLDASLMTSKDLKKLLLMWHIVIMLTSSSSSLQNYVNLVFLLCYCIRSVTSLRGTSPYHWATRTCLNSCRHYSESYWCPVNIFWICESISIFTEFIFCSCEL